MPALFFCSLSIIHIVAERDFPLDRTIFGGIRVVVVVVVVGGTVFSILGLFAVIL